MAVSSGRRVTAPIAVKRKSLGWSMSSGTALALPTSGSRRMSRNTRLRAGWAGGPPPRAASKTLTSFAAASGRWAAF
eukprot:7819211-Alexandrium_andersonii.AAC.1